MSRKPWPLVLKLFLPSWNFFNDFSAVPQLEFQSTAAGPVAPWQPLYATRTTRSWGRVVFNPEGNLELLERSLIDRIATELSSGAPAEAFGSSASGELLTRIARSRLQPRYPFSPGRSFRYRLVLVGGAAGVEIIYESAAYPLWQVAR